MRSKKVILNAIFSLTQQAIAVTCGLIVPRLIISTYGSDVNGAISSITQFLSFITLLEAGIGGVERAALYKPLAQKNSNELSGIIKASDKFFKKIAYVFLAYSIFIAVFYRVISNSYQFEWIFTFALVIVISIASFSQYFFGLSFSILLQADQRQYVSTFLQIISYIIYAIVACILIHFGINIIVVKLCSSLIFIVRPIIIKLYVSRYYCIDNSVSPNLNALNQKWYALGQHIAYFLFSNTDIVVLTIFTNLKEVSVYSVYFLVSNGLQRVIQSFTGTFEALYGNIIALEDKNHLAKAFNTSVALAYFIIFTLFIPAFILFIPFVKIYTNSIQDANYVRPLLAFLILFSAVIYNLRQPLEHIITASGLFKQTQIFAYVEAGINISLSIILVNIYGINGVVAATVIACLIRSICLYVYVGKNIIKINNNKHIRAILIYPLFSIIIIYVISTFLANISITSYYQWCIAGVLTLFISSIFSYILTKLLFNKELFEIIYQIKNIYLRLK